MNGRTGSWWTTARAGSLAIALSGLSACTSKDDVPVRITGPEIPGLEESEAPVRQAFEKSFARVEANPEDGEAWGRLGMLAQAHVFLEQAIVCYLEAEKLAPETSRWPHLRGQVALLLSDSKQAEATFRRALELDTKDLVAVCSLAFMHQDRGEDEAARQLYRKAIDEMDPNCLAAITGLGQLAARAGANNSAKAALHRALEIEPSLSLAHAALAKLYAREGKVEEAEFHQRWALRGTHKVPLPDKLMVEVTDLGVSYTGRMKRGKSAGNLGLWEVATSDFRAAVDLRRDSAEANYFLASALERKGDTEAALKIFTKVTGMKSFQAEAWLHIGRIQAAGKRWQEADQALEQVLRLDPRHAEALHAEALHAEALCDRGRFLLARGRFEEALTVFEEAISLQPDYAPFHVEKGRLLLRREVESKVALRDAAMRAREKERAEQALRAFERALELQADLEAAYDGAGRAGMQIGQLETNRDEKARRISGAIERFRQLANYFPARREHHVSLIKALSSAGRKKEAIAAIERARYRFPGDKRFQPVGR